jgi:hypothetical protein
VFSPFVCQDFVTQFMTCSFLDVEWLPVEGFYLMFCDESCSFQFKIVILTQYGVLPLWCLWAQWALQHAPSDASFLCVKAATLRDVINGPLCSSCFVYMHHSYIVSVLASSVHLIKMRIIHILSSYVMLWLVWYCNESYVHFVSKFLCLTVR